MKNILSKVKLGLITPEYPPDFGGVGHSVHRIAQGLADKGVNVSVIVMPEVISQHSMQSEQIIKQVDGAVSVYRITPPLRGATSGPELHTECFELLKQIGIQQHLNLLHCFFLGINSFLTGLVATELEIPWIASVRGDDLHKRLFRIQQYPYVYWTLEHADAVTFVSADLKRRADHVNKGNGLRRIIWNSISDATVNDFQSVFPDLHEVPTIGSVGRFRRKKGTDYLVEACSLLPFNVKLLLIGDFAADEQPYWNNLIQTYSSTNVDIVVTGITEHSTIATYYRQLDVLAIPSLHDGCPNVLLEGLALGLPIVASRCGALGDMLDASQSGIVVPPGDTNSLAEALIKSITDGTFRQKCWDNGKDFVRFQWTLKHEIEEWISVYTGLV